MLSRRHRRMTFPENRILFLLIIPDEIMP